MACRGIPLAEIPLPQAGQARLQGFQVFILTYFPNILCGGTGEINHYGTAATEPKQLHSASGEKRFVTISPKCWDKRSAPTKHSTMLTAKRFVEIATQVHSRTNESQQCEWIAPYSQGVDLLSKFLRTSFELMTSQLMQRDLIAWYQDDGSPHSRKCKCKSYRCAMKCCRLAANSFQSPLIMWNSSWFHCSNRKSRIPFCQTSMSDFFIQSARSSDG